MLQLASKWIWAQKLAGRSSGLPPHLAQADVPQLLASPLPGSAAVLFLFLGCLHCTGHISICCHDGTSNNTANNGVQGYVEGIPARARDTKSKQYCLSGSMSYSCWRCHFPVLLLSYLYPWAACIRMDTSTSVVTTTNTIMMQEMDTSMISNASQPLFRKQEQYTASFCWQFVDPLALPLPCVAAACLLFLGCL